MPGRASRGSRRARAERGATATIATYRIPGLRRRPHPLLPSRTTIPALRIRDGNWGGSSLADVAAVVSSVAAAFPDPGELPPISVEPTRRDDEPPIALAQPNAAGELVVRLNVRGNLWARLAFQFAHEYCHVLADPTSWQPGRYAWLEEALCETGSLFALRSLARVWREAPPYPNWQSYADELDRYARERLSAAERSLPAGVGFLDWFSDRVGALEADSSRRDDNTIVASALLPVFESQPLAWDGLGSLHAATRQSPASLAVLFRLWVEACPPSVQPAVTALGIQFGIHPAPRH